MRLASGTRLGPYEVLAPLGAGGMGEVYRALDTRLGREVALKVLPERFVSTPAFRQRFEREARAISSLQHPHICVLHDVGGDESSGLFLVMEFLEGETLAERVKRGPLPLRELLKIGMEIAGALDKAHRKGLAHRDLKPANIMLTKSGAKLMDFGLAKAAASDSLDVAAARTFSAQATATGGSPPSPITSAGALIGTIQYMSPEQVEGREADARSDIFAFGATLYEMATGTRAFEGKSQISVASAILEKDPEPISKAQPLSPSALDRVVAQCLAKNPDDRFQSAHDIALELRWISEAAQAPQPTPAEIGAPTSRLRRGLPWLVAAVALVAAGVLAAGYIARAPEPALHFRTVTNFAGVQAQPALSPDGRSVAFVSNHDGHYNVYVTLVSGGSLVQITNDSRMKSRPMWSPDGSTIAFGEANDSGTWDIWQVPALGGTPRRLILNAFDPAWSPDGRSLAYANGSTGTIWMATASGQNAHQLTPTQPGWFATEPRFSPDGHRLAFADREGRGSPYGELALADLDTGNVRHLTHDGALAISPAWSPDGRFVFFASSRAGTLNIWKIDADGSGLRQITAGEGDDAQLDVSADGKRIVFATLRQNIALARLDLQAKPGQSSVKVLTTDPARNQFMPAYSPDGKHLAYFTNLKGTENEAVWVSDSDGSNAVELVQDARINLFPVWTPDSRYLVYVSVPAGALVPSGPLHEEPGNAQFRRVPIAGGAPETLGEGESEDVGRDGRVLFADIKGQINAFDPQTGKTQTFGTLPANWWRPLWSSDQQSIAYMVYASKENDPNAGLWVSDFKTPPRQIFRGWATGFTRGPGDELYLVEGKPDFTGVLWKVDWNGQGLARTSLSIPIPYNFNYSPTLDNSQIGCSPDGRYLAFQSEQVLQESLGMIDNVR